MYLLILMNIIWSAAYVFMKWGIAYMAPMHLLFLRMLVSLVVMIAISHRQWVWIKGRDLARCIAMGAIIATAHGLGFLGIDRSHAVDASVLYAIEPITAIIWARILLKEHMDIWRFISLAMALTGFVMLSNISFDGILSNLTLIGNIIMLLGVFADGLFSPVAKPVCEKHPARVVLTTAIFFTTIFILPFAAMSPFRQNELSWQPFAAILYLAIPCTCFGWTLWLYFLKQLPVNVIALTVFIQPVIGPFISHFWLGEQIGSRIWFGGSVILVAVAIALFKRKTSREELVAEGVIH